MTDPKGTKAAVDAAMQATGGGLPAESEQLGLLDPLAPAGEPPAASIEGQLRQGPGRRPGSRNRRTQEIVDYLMAKYPMPLEGLLRIASMSIDELRGELKCTAFEAGQERRLAMIAALPYLNQRQPIAVDVTNHKFVHLTILEGGDGLDGDDPDIVTVQAQIVSVQDVSDKASDDV